MAVFRVERNRGYTVMSNHHLRNKELSLKAKGLLSQMLSLPEDWDYTLKGLSLINREKIDAIREAIKELERAGYIVRSRERGEINISSLTFLRLSLRPVRAAFIAAPKALKSYFGTGLFAIVIHPITFYCSSFFLDMSTQFYLSAKIIPISNKGKSILTSTLKAYNRKPRIDFLLSR